MIVASLLVPADVLLITRELLLDLAVVLLLSLAHLARRATVAIEPQPSAETDGSE